jgi:hypothetical protein
VGLKVTMATAPILGSAASQPGRGETATLFSSSKAAPAASW